MMKLELLQNTNGTEIDTDCRDSKKVMLYRHKFKLIE